MGTPDTRHPPSLTQVLSQLVGSLAPLPALRRTINNLFPICPPLCPKVSRADLQDLPNSLPPQPQGLLSKGSTLFSPGMGLLGTPLEGRLCGHLRFEYPMTGVSQAAPPQFPELLPMAFGGVRTGRGLQGTPVYLWLCVSQPGGATGWGRGMLKIKGWGDEGTPPGWAPYPVPPGREGRRW